jgi:hypothetical protein
LLACSFGISATLQWDNNGLVKREKLERFGDVGCRYKYPTSYQFA